MSLLSAWAAGVVLGLSVWLLFTALVWKTSPIARREFPGGAGRLFVAQAVAYSHLTLFVWLPVRLQLREVFGLSEGASILAAASVTLATWAALRYGVPYTRRAADDWVRWAHTPYPAP